MTLLSELTERTYILPAADWKAKYGLGNPDARSIINGTLLEWYEHPTNGDEDGWVIITPDGKVHPTNEYEILTWRDE